jgi:hypothetical protein
MRPRVRDDIKANRRLLRTKDGAFWRSTAQSQNGPGEERSKLDLVLAHRPLRGSFHGTNGAECLFGL